MLPLNHKRVTKSLALPVAKKWQFKVERLKSQPVEKSEH
jgi:hypothetical protein